MRTAETRVGSRVSQLVLASCIAVLAVLGISATPAAASVGQCPVGHYCADYSMQRLDGVAGLSGEAHIGFYWHNASRTQLTFNSIWLANWSTDRSCSFTANFKDGNGHDFSVGPYNCNSSGTAVGNFGVAPLIPATTVVRVWFYDGYNGTGNYAFHSLSVSDFNHTYDCMTVPPCY